MKQKENGPGEGTFSPGQSTMSFMEVGLDLGLPGMELQSWRPVKSNLASMFSLFLQQRIPEH